MFFFRCCKKLFHKSEPFFLFGPRLRLFFPFWANLSLKNVFHEYTMYGFCFWIVKSYAPRKVRYKVGSLFHGKKLTSIFHFGPRLKLLFFFIFWAKLSLKNVFNKCTMYGFCFWIVKAYTPRKVRYKVGSFFNGKK